MRASDDEVCNLFSFFSNLRVIAIWDKGLRMPKTWKIKPCLIFGRACATSRRWQTTCHFCGENGQISLEEINV